MEWRKCRSCYNGGSKFDSLMYVQKDLVVAWMQSKIYFRQQSAPIDQKEFALITTKIFPLTTCKFRAAKCDTSEWTASYLITNELIGRRHAPLLVQPRWSEGALQSHELRGLPHRVTICSSVRVGFLQLGKRKERRRAIFHLQSIMAQLHDKGVGIIEQNYLKGKENTNVFAKITREFYGLKVA